MTLISRVSFGSKPEWLDRRRSTRRVEVSQVMPTESVHPDGSSSPYEHLMAAFRSLYLARFQEKEKGEKCEEGSAEEGKAFYTASRLAAELAMLDGEEKQRLLKNTRVNVVA